MHIYKPQILDFQTSDQFWKKAEDFVVDLALDNSAEHGFTRIALAGGSTPLPLYDQLAKNPVMEWEKVELYQTDERYVPKDHKDSNQNSLRQIFAPEVLDRVRSYHFFNTDLEIPDSVNQYNEILESLDDPYFDLSVLGVGPDGHIASLFPNQAYLKHQDENVLATISPAEFTVTKRLSLTIEAVLNSRTILVLLKGNSKTQVLEELLEGSMGAVEFPAKFLLAHPNLHIFTCLT